MEFRYHINSYNYCLFQNLLICECMYNYQDSKVVKCDLVFFSKL